MKWMFGKAAMWSWLIVMTAGAAVAGQDPLPPPLVLPEGEGKALVEASCKSCHNLNGLARRAPMEKEAWQSLVGTMVEYGATLEAEQVTTVVEYLTKNFGPKDKEGAGDTASAPSEEDAAPLKLMKDACTGCHDAEIITSQMKEKEAWEITIKTMIGKGAAVTNDEIPILLEYLVKRYGPSTQ